MYTQRIQNGCSSDADMQAAKHMTTKRVTSGIPSVTQRGYQMEPEHNITKLNETKRNEEARAAEKEGAQFEKHE